MSSVQITLNSENNTYPQDNSLLSGTNVSLILISSVKSFKNATGKVWLTYPQGKSESHAISELMEIGVPLHCEGFRFIGDNLTKGQELIFDYQEYV